MVINTMFPNNASPRTLLQLRIAENMFMEESPSAMLPLEKDIMHQEQDASEWTTPVLPCQVMNKSSTY
jgi:hypothetical protein